MTVEGIIKKHLGDRPEPKTNTDMVYQWESWYRGNVDDFHHYRIYNGEDYIEVDLLSMQMAKFGCETWANLLLNEKCDIVLPEGPKEKFDNILKLNNFWYKANNGLEKSFAMGMGAIVMGVNDLGIGDKGTINKDKAKIKLNFVKRTKIKPLTVEDGVVTECAFVTETSYSKRVVVHQKDNQGQYIIFNYEIDKDGKTIREYQFPTRSQEKWYWILQPNIANNMDDSINDDDNLGISVYANAIDSLKDLDTKFDSFYNEYILGRKRVYVSEDTYKVSNKDGTKVRTFDPRDTLYYFTEADDDGKKRIQSDTDSLRHESLIEGINAALNYFGMKLGLGMVHFRFDGGGVATATQVISENSTLYRNIKKHELIIENALIEMTKAVIKASKEFTNDPVGDVAEADIEVIFDDSIIEDKEAQMKRDKEDVMAGLMSKQEYREKWYGETPEDAEANYRKFYLYEIINNYLGALNAGAMTPEHFVDIVYGDREDKEAYVEYIKSQIETGDIIDDFYGQAEGDLEEEIEEPEEDIEEEIEA